LRDLNQRAGRSAGAAGEDARGAAPIFHVVESIAATGGARFDHMTNSDPGQETAAGSRVPLYIRLLFFLLAIYLPITRGHFWSTDEVGMYHQTRSLWEQGNFSTAPGLLDSLPGRGGHSFVPWGVGQSILALPLYGLGKGVRHLLESAGAQRWIQTFAGPPIGDVPDRRWGGEVEIFFVNLFNCIAVAGLGTVFFAFNLGLGAAPRWALTATLMMGFASHIAGFSAGFFQHPAEALFLLWTFYFLFHDSLQASWRRRLMAGFAAAIMLVVRIQTAMLLPILAAYLFRHCWKRQQADLKCNRRLVAALMQCAPFLIPAAAGVLAAALVNYAKFGEFSIRGSYATLNPFTGSLWAHLYAYLFSPGESIFLFSPLLVVAPWYFRAFARRYGSETVVILTSLAISLTVYGKLHLWHGQWCFGPRFFMHLVPLLLLPLGIWLETLRRPAWIAVGSLVAFGVFVEVLHIAVNVSYVYYREGYSNFSPPFGFLFIPDVSQIPAHLRALLAWDYRVDPWLVLVARYVGIDRALMIGLALLWFFVWCLRRLLRELRKAEACEVHSLSPLQGNSK
jgi:hypothetical protein